MLLLFCVKTIYYIYKEMESHRARDWFYHLRHNCGQKHLGAPHLNFIPINFDFLSLSSAFEQSHHLLFNYNRLCCNTGHHFGGNYTTGSEWDSGKIKRRWHREKSIHSRHTSRFDQVSYVTSVAVIALSNAFAQYFSFLKCHCTQVSFWTDHFQ